MNFIKKLFGKDGKSVAENNKLRDELLDKINSIIYKLDNGDYNKDLSESVIDEIQEELKKKYRKLDNSFALSGVDIRNGIDNITDSINDLNYSLDGNIDYSVKKTSKIFLKDVQTIIDLQDGVISSIAPKVNSSDKSAVELNKKQAELSAFINDLEKLKSDYAESRSDTRSIIDELEQRLAVNEDSYESRALLDEIKSNENILEVTKTDSDLTQGCISTIKEIQNYAKGIIKRAKFSVRDLVVANKVLDIDELKKVMSDPSALDSILKQINHELGKTYDKLEKLANAKIQAPSRRELSPEEKAKYEEEKAKRAAREAEMDKEVLERKKMIQAKNAEKTGVKPVAPIPSIKPTNDAADVKKGEIK